MAKIIGHRGAAGLVAENTLESVAKALDYNVDGIEIDIHACKTGELVVLHDATLDRTTTGRGAIADFALRRLQKIRTKEGYSVPTLSQVLDLVDGQCVLNIEIKGIGAALPTIELLEEYIKDTKWEYDDFIISSFDHSQLFQVKQVSSRFRLGVLTEGKSNLVLSVAKELNAFSIHSPIKYLSQDEVVLAKKEGFQVYVWTVNEQNLITQSKNWKVDGIITDFPSFAE